MSPTDVCGQHRLLERRFDRLEEKQDSMIGKLEQLVNMSGPIAQLGDRVQAVEGASRICAERINDMQTKAANKANGGDGHSRVLAGVPWWVWLVVAAALGPEGVRLLLQFLVGG